MSNKKMRYRNKIIAIINIIIILHSKCEQTASVWLVFGVRVPTDAHLRANEVLKADGDAEHITLCTTVMSTAFQIECGQITEVWFQFVTSVCKDGTPNLNLICFYF